MNVSFQDDDSQQSSSQQSKVLYVNIKLLGPLEILEPRSHTAIQPAFSVYPIHKETTKKRATNVKNPQTQSTLIL